MSRYLSTLLFLGLAWGQIFDPMTGEEVKPQYDPNTGELVKPIINKYSGEILSLRERAISDAQSISMYHWALYPTFVGATFFVSLIGIMNLTNDEPWENSSFLMGSATLSLTIPYLLLNQEEEIIYPNDIINESEKKIYKSSFYNKLNERRILYSIIGVPITAGVGFLTLMVLLGS